jgi:exosome complex component RRP4
MSNIIVEERAVVIPGELLADGMDYLPGENTYREGDRIYSKVIGLVSLNGRVIKITPLAGPYIPKEGDKIIVKVIDILMTGWRVDTGTAYSAVLNVKDASNRFIKKEEDLSSILAIGDFLIVKIIKVTSQNLIDLTMREPGLKKISGGRVIRINSQKVPRVIGKKASMLSLIKERTGCEVTVGQNGFIWVKGTPEGEYLAEKTIKMIADRSHESGLTEQIEQFLTNNALSPELLKAGEEIQRKDRESEERNSGSGFRSFERSEGFSRPDRFDRHDHGDRPERFERRGFGGGRFSRDHHGSRPSFSKDRKPDQGSSDGSSDNGSGQSAGSENGNQEDKNVEEY